MEKFSQKEIISNKKYLELLSKDFPSITSAVGEVVNLSAIMNLPKGTEHFLTDIHGENEAFYHVLQNGSGAVRKKVLEALKQTLTTEDLDELTSLIYYPAEKLELIKKTKPEKYLNNWYELTIYRLVKVCRETATKYTRSKVNKALPEDFRYVMEELLQEDESRTDKKDYYNMIIRTLVDCGRADYFIEELCGVIKRLCTDHLHIIGDIFDRGPGPQLVMDQLMEHHSMDIQWGNHDILWMGAASGNTACIANVIRIALRYGNMDVLETGYGINLLPLATFANRIYGDDDIDLFRPKAAKDENWKQDPDMLLMAKMHKAVAIMQFKLEEQIITRHPEYKMNDRILLPKINYETGDIDIDGTSYPLLDKSFPTVNPADPSALNEEEQSVIDKLVSAFKKSERLQKHVRFLFAKGSMYLTYNGNLLFHACMIMNHDGTFTPVKIDGHWYSGKALMDIYDQKARESYFSSPNVYDPITDFLWYLWCNENSPLFGKDKMATFERYYIEDKATHKETYNNYYQLMGDPETGEKTADTILEEFGIDPAKGHMINGHVPVKLKSGESPIRANGKQLVIDGGFAEAYHEATGIAGYTLTFNSYGLLLTSHKPFISVEKALEEGMGLAGKLEVVESTFDRICVKDTDVGKEIKQQLHDLDMLICAYKRGIIKEKEL
jgi:fructose-1,6-bisphosphatase-3